MLTPEEIQSREFLVSLRGYDRDEVHAFLDRVAEQVRELQSGAGGPGPAAREDEAAEPSAMFAQIGEETHRILEAAHEAGTAIKRTARQEADRDLQAARAEAARLIAEGERRREEIEAVVTGLEASKAQLGEELRQVARNIEGSLRDLLGAERTATTVREALAAEALPDDAEPPDASSAAEVETESPAATAPVGEPVGEPVEEPVATDAEPVEALDVELSAGEGPLAARQAALSPLNIRLVRQIKRGLHDVQNVVLDRLRRAEGRGDLEAFLPTDAELGDFTAPVADILEEAYQAGSIRAAQLVDRELPGPGEERDLTGAFVDDAADRIRGGLAANLRMGLEVGEDLSALNGRVSAVFGEIKQATADEWAATHLIRSYELGQLDAWSVGGVTHREWVVGPELRCPEGRCRQNTQSAVLPVGEAYPSGHLAPPVHAGCTCTTIPVAASHDAPADESYDSHTAEPGL